MNFKALENEVVLLKPLEQQDTQGLLEAASYPEIWPYMSTTIEKMLDVNNFVDKALTTKREKLSFHL